jgi:hypothetical protein
MPSSAALILVYQSAFGVTTGRIKMWLYWYYIPIFPSQDTSNWKFVKFWIIISERNYLSRYSALSHTYDSSGDSSQLFIVQFLIKKCQLLPQRNSRASCGSGTSLQSPSLAECHQAVSVAATGRLTRWIKAHLLPTLHPALRVPIFF